jgi:hypothetical protein
MPTNVVTSANGNNSAAQAAAALAAAQREQNRQFMALSINKKAPAAQANGGALSQSFVAGQALTYNMPTANNAFLTGYWIRVALTITLAAGTSATYNANAGFPLNVIDSIQLNYGGNQHNYRPFIMKYVTQLRRASAQIQPRAVVAGQNDTYLQQYYKNISPTSPAAGSNTVNFALFVPLNLLHPQDVRGILPAQQGETTAQLTVNCAGNLLGNDPILNAYSANTGTGQAVSSVTGTISVLACYKDGESYSGLTHLQPNLSGIETVQFMKDVSLNNVLAGQVYRGKLSYLQKIPWVFLVAVDGQQSTSFATTSNIQRIETSKDSTGNGTFMAYGNNTNMDVREFYDDLSGGFGGLLQQDIDEGVFPLVYGPIFQQASADLLEGQHYLDTTPATGWTDWHYGFQFGTVGTVSGINVRIEPHVIFLNSPLQTA